MDKKNTTITLHIENGHTIDEIKRIVEFVENLESYEDIWNEVFYIKNGDKEKIQVMVTYYDDVDDIQIEDI